MALATKTGEVVETDVLVIGAGLAGCMAAIRAKAFAPRVVLVDKAVVARSGASGWAYYLLAPPPPKERDVWKKELVEKGNYLSDQDWVDVLLQEHEQRISDMESWGVPFERDDKGDLIAKAGRGHRETRFITSDGLLRMEALKKRARDIGVQIVERIMCTDLLTSDGVYPTSGSVIGALGFETRDGSPVVFKSKAVIIATGAASPTTNLSSDGLSMAYRAGAELRSMEFCVHAACYLGYGKKNLGTLNVLFQGLGPWFVNSKGERFMEKYDPVLLERSDWTLLCQSIAKESFAGNGPAIMDMSHANEEDLAWFAKLHPGRMEPFTEAGLDIRKDPIEIVPMVHLTSNAGDGGITIDTWGRSSVPGLYAAGSTCKNGVHGTYTVGGINLAFCCSSGHRAGEQAGRDSQQTGASSPRQEQVAALRNQFLTPLGRKSGLHPRTIVSKMNTIIAPAMVGIIRREDRLRNALAALDSLAQEAKKARAKDVHELIEAREAENLLGAAHLAFLSALERKESRHAHYREDYPYRDDIDWLKWVVVRQGGDGKVVIGTDPVPMERYSVKPERRERIPHAIQFP